MPKTKLQEVVFTILMVFVMVYATCTPAIPPHPGAQQTKRQGRCNSRIYRYPPDRQRSDYPLPCFPSGSRLDTVRHTEPQEGSHQRQRRESTKRKYPHSGHSTPYSNSNRSFRSPTGQEPGSSYGSLLPSAPVVPEHHSVSPAPSAPSAKPYFKGSYVSPESDATDERNQKELNFSLDEARVIAEINPQMLSLRELYTVAISYKNTPEQFYKIIDISVKIYPASPVANLNAAAAAIERGNTQAAGRYLQMASHETLAYKNCRGAYELLCNNTYEGIRLLKAAKAEGSEEATYNLKIFFESNQTNIQ